MGSKNRLPSLQKQAAIPKRERCPTQKLCPIQRPPHRKIPQAASHIRVGVVRRRCLTASPVVPGKRDKNEGLGIDGWVSHLCQLGACVSVWFAICPVPHSLPLPTHAYIPSPPPPPPPTARNIGRVLGGVNGEPVGGRRRSIPTHPPMSHTIKRRSPLLRTLSHAGRVVERTTGGIGGERTTGGMGRRYRENLGRDTASL